MTNENPEVVQGEVIDTDVAAAKTKSFLNRHKTKLIVAATTVAGATVFLLGRASKDVVEDVDITVTTPDDSDSSQS